MDPVPVLVSLPGFLVAGACFGFGAVAWRRGVRGPRSRWLAALLGGLGVFALLGWGLRPLISDVRTAFALGVLLLAWETLLHGLLLGFVAQLDSPRVGWLRTGTGPVAVVVVTLVSVGVVLLVPGAFIGHVGRLDGVPGLYRLAAGPAAVPWAILMIGVRAFSLWVAVDAHRRASPGDAPRFATLAWSLALFLGLFLVWLTNPVVIHLTGEAYLPGPVRFALPLVWTAALAGGLGVLAGAPMRRSAPCAQP